MPTHVKTYVLVCVNGTFGIPWLPQICNTCEGIGMSACARTAIITWLPHISNMCEKIGMGAYSGSGQNHTDIRSHSHM